MNSKRSTRRSVNPPDSDESDSQVDSRNSLSDVESILDEIECLVAGGGTDETAKPTPVVESNETAVEPTDPMNITLETDEDDQDIKQLSVDLDVAIAAELTKLDAKEESVSDSGEIDPDSEQVVDDSKIHEGHDDEDVDEAPHEEKVLNNSHTEVGLGYRVLKVMSGPVAGMSRGSRSVISVFAISMAFWVPLVWILAFTTTPSEINQAADHEMSSTLDQGTDEKNFIQVDSGSEAVSDLNVQ